MAHAAKNVFTGVSKKGGGGGEVDGRVEVGKKTSTCCLTAMRRTICPGRTSVFNTPGHISILQTLLIMLTLSRAC